MDGFGELHVAHAGFEIGQPYWFGTSNGADKLRLDAPAAELIRGDFQQFQFFVTGTAHKNLFAVVEFGFDCAAAAEKVDLVSRPAQVDSTEMIESPGRRRLIR